MKTETIIEKYDCPNCGVVHGPLKREFPDIPDLGQRMSPGEECPSGECNECGSLVHPHESKTPHIAILSPIPTNRHLSYLAVEIAEKFRPFIERGHFKQTDLAMAIQQGIDRCQEAIEKATA